MNRLLNALRKFPDQEISFAKLKAFVESYDFDSINYHLYTPYACPPGDFGRNLLLNQRLGCMLAYWPPGVKSPSIELNNSFGIGVVLEGSLKVTYIDPDTKEEIHSDLHQMGHLNYEESQLNFRYENIHPEKGAVSLHIFHMTDENIGKQTPYELRPQTEHDRTRPTLSAHGVVIAKQSPQTGV